MSLRHAIMVDLWREEGTGYEIAKRFQEGFGFSWKASHPQIYTELKKLTDLHWVEFNKVEQEHKPAKKIYSLTQDGLQALIEWIDSPVDIAPIRDAFLIKMAAGSLATPSILLKEVRERKIIADEKLAFFREVEKQYFSSKIEKTPETQFPFLSLRAGILTFESYSHWFEEVIEYVESLEK